MRIPPTLLTTLVAALLSAGATVGQQSGGPAASPATSSPASQPFTLQGRVVSLEGDPVAGAAVWVGKLLSRSVHLAESRANGSGEFTLAVHPSPLSEQDRLVVGASHPGYEEAADFLIPEGHSGLPKFTLFLSRSEETFEEPSLDLVDVWLLPRVSRRHTCSHKAGPECSSFQAAVSRYRRKAKDRETLEEFAHSTMDSKLTEARLLAALALMRLGAWNAAEKTLASVGHESTGLPEGWLLQGVLWNFLHKPAEATQALNRARQNLGRTPLVDLELGRAEFQAEDWTAAEESLDAALVDHALRPQAHYLRARALISQGMLEAASREASEITRSGGRKLLPPVVQSFIVDVKRRLEERSLQPITSVIGQPVAELEQVVMPLRGLDPAAPPPPGGLETFLSQVGQTVEKFFRDFTNTTATEVLWQTRLDRNGSPVESRNEQFYYVFLSRSEMGRWWVEEYRGNRQGQPSNPGGLEAGYMATSGFASSLVVFHPLYQPGMAYRYLGRQRVGDEWAYVVGFAQRPGDSDPLGFFNIAQSRAASLYLQGIAWISADQHEVLRMRTDLLQPVPEIRLKRETAEVDYRPYRFASSPRAFWLPNRVSVSVDWGGRRLRNEHLFSQFRLFKVDAQEAKGAGREAKKAAESPP